MTRMEEEEVYYDFRNQDVLSRINGYLSSHLGDQAIENRKLADRIMYGDTSDNFDEDNLILIPRLNLREFLETFEKHSSGYTAFLNHSKKFKNTVISELPQYGDGKDFADLTFNRGMHEFFLEELAKNYSESTREQANNFRNIMELTYTEIVNKWIREIFGYACQDNSDSIQELNPTVMEINPQKLDGHWNEGWALDLHTTSSTPVGVDEHGHTRFETVRPPIAEELFKLKYRSEKNRIETIAKPASDFLSKFKSKWQLDLIIPIPPSDNNRAFQPVYELAKAIGGKVNLPVDFKTLRKTKSTSQLKEIDDPDQRKKILKDAFDIALNSLNGKDVLIFDDLYRSGETLNAVCDILLKKGKARGVYVLTITKTRSKR